MADVDIVSPSRLAITQQDKVATAGSCFAQHIAARLSGSGFNYLVTERPHSTLPMDVARAHNYGIYSARFGNIYTVAQLHQLIDRVYGAFMPAEDVWFDMSGRIDDPFRPGIEPSGFPTMEEYLRDRAQHFAAVREMLETMTVFIFTLGLTECWSSKQDGAVYPLCPGVAGGSFSAERYEFQNHSLARMNAELDGFISKLKEINPNCRVILTVSPVPLAATYEPRHVLVSTTYSKSALRVLAEEAVQRHPHVEYFPSYEIITGSFNRGGYYAEDLRTVRSEGVDHVMRLFMRHFTDGSSAPDIGSVDEPKAESTHVIAKTIADLVCEEAILGSFS
ncbi:GSCFA domain-containing protein [Ensifer sp. NM-2]|uniref:GSCFA domain-containing protein n=1 Tax=Ensifer sp. NM-2 TaxID=2109730 RepID=UPI001304BCB5|nr:GSCFA domain-containing protein [Ensifer sp. NM-2]